MSQTRLPKTPILIRTTTLTTTITILQIFITKTHIVLSGEYNRDLTVYGYTYYLQANNGIDIYAFTNPEGNICLRAACAIR